MEYYLRANIVSINIRSKSRELNYKKEIVGLIISGLRVSGLRVSGFGGYWVLGGYLAVDRLLKSLRLELGPGRPTPKGEKAWRARETR
jgi:hypothetical protein